MYMVTNQLFCRYCYYNVKSKTIIIIILLPFIYMGTCYLLIKNNVLIIAPDEKRFLNQKVLIIPYFSSKTCIVGTR